jgi:hypothetical protein
MKVNQNAIIGGLVVGTATYFIAKKNWKLALIGLVAGGVAGYYVGEMMAKKSAPAQMPMGDTMGEEEKSSFDESVEPRFQFNPTINKMMPVGKIDETKADQEFDIRGDGLDLDFN